MAEWYKALRNLSLQPQFYAFLMTSRKKALYLKVFQKLRDEFNVNPLVFTSDYEFPMRSAARQVWEGIRMPGCTFHFRQCIRRKYNELIFPKPTFPAYKARHKFILRMLMNLPFLPSSLIDEGFFTILEAQKARRLLTWFNPINKYFYDLWIKRVGAENFSMHRRDHRTNNFNESFNARMNKLLPMHPNIYSFLECMRNTMLMLNHNLDNKKVYKDKSKMTKNLLKAWSLLDERKLSLNDFLISKFFCNSNPHLNV